MHHKNFIGERYDSLRKIFRQRGQVMLLYALLIPVMFLFLGVAVDLGWYYLNVSRLQNAADASAIAGAHAMIANDTENFSSYGDNVVLVGNFYGGDEPYSTATAGDSEAANYAVKNLSNSTSASSVKNGDAYSMTDNWGIGGSSEVTMTPNLYKVGETYYYVITLNERVRHLFLPGMFDAMNAPVTAIAMLTKNAEDPTPPTPPSPVTLKFDSNGGSFGDNSTTDSKSLTNPTAMEDGDTSDPLSSDKGTPTYSNREFKGWSTNPNPSAGDTIDIYLDGAQLTKTELTKLFGDNDTVTLYAVWVEVKPHNNRTLWEQMHYLIAKYVYDPDWNVSVNKFGAALNDLNFIPTGNAAVLNNNKIVYINMAADTRTNNSGAYVKDVDKLFLDFRPDGFIVRVHALINVNSTYAVRSGKEGDDPLYIRIEAEPKQGTVGNEPQQIIININADNTADSKRPLFFYYDGPLTYNGTYPDRIAQPVILNMTTDFKGVLFMPEVPVVINGNGHKFEGFIVASEFRYAAQSGTKTAKYTQNGCAMYYYIDSSNNIYTTSATGTDALDTYSKYATKSTYSGFNLSSESHFRNFTAESDVNFMYVYYDYNCVMDSSPFYLNTGDLIPLYKLVNGKQVRVTNWDDVNLYDSNDMNKRNLIPKVVTDTSRKGTVRLTNGSPSPLYDEAGNPVYFCDDYVNLTGTYTVFTLDRVADGTRDPKEFLLTKTDELNTPNTDDWK